MTKSGSNYDQLLQNHDNHYKTLEKLLDTLASYKINVRVIQRFNYTLNDVEWADAILTAGGDGTFLLAAAKVDSKKPIFGINTDLSKNFIFSNLSDLFLFKSMFQENSEGYLLLPQDQSKSYSETIKKILNGQFK